MVIVRGITRFLAGEPVFQESDEQPGRLSPRDAWPHQPQPPAQQPQAGTPPQDPTKTSVDERGYKIIPEIGAGNLVTRRFGERMVTTVWVTNESDEILRVDTTNVCGQNRVHNRQMAARQRFELLVYDGDVKKSASNDDAHIDYRLMRSGDVFRVEYDVKYSREADGAFLPQELHGDEIRDI